jgi:hypothetical protein
MVNYQLKSSILFIAASSPSAVYRPYGPDVLYLSVVMVKLAACSLMCRRGLKRREVWFYNEKENGPGCACDFSGNLT